MAFIAASNAAASGSPGATSVAPSAPTGTQDDDLMFAYLFTQYTIGATPSGWTLLGKNSTNTKGLYWKKAASESGTYTFQQASAGYIAAFLYTWRGGFNKSDPIDGFSNTDYTTSNTTCRAASFSVTDPDSIILYFGGLRVTGPESYSPPTNPGTFNEDYDSYPDDGYNDAYVCVELASYQWSGSGATGNIDATTGSSQSNKHAFAVSLTPGPDYEIDCDGTSFSFSGAAVDLSLIYYLDCEGTTFSFGGAPISFNRSFGETKTQTFQSLIQNGGGELAYLWHVGGYPWAVTSNNKLIDALSNTSDATVQAARKRLFGSNEWTAVGTVTPAYTVPIFPGLLPEFGKIKYQMDESKGFLKGGDWSVKIIDQHHGHTWQHAAAGDTIWGLEGLHRIANVKQSSVNGWAYLQSNLLRNVGGSAPAVVSINEESGNLLRTRVDAVSGDEYVVVWINGEAIAVDGVSGAFPSYDLEICEFGGNGRGLYRSRKRDHFTDALADLNPILADVPGGVAGRYCWLYAIPLDRDGALMINPQGEPLIAEIEGGVISPNISTVDNKTSIQIRPKLSALERTVNVSAAKGHNQSMAGFVFSRGASGTTLGSIQENIQMPHLVIREYTIGYRELYDKYISWIEQNTEHPDKYLTDQYLTERYIWICPKNTTILKETPQEVVDLINNELQACYEQSSDRYSEDTVLSKPYAVALRKGRYMLQYTGEEQTARDLLIDFVGGDKLEYLYPLITGPLAWVFALGNPIREDNAYTLIKHDHKNIQYIETAIGPAIIDASDSTIPYDYWKNNAYWMRSYYRLPDYSKYSIPTYYYSWDWNNHPIVEESIQWSGILQPTNVWPPPTGYIYLPSGTDENSYPVGESLTLGDGRWFPRLHTTISAVEDENTDTNFTKMTPGSILTDGSREILQGTSLFYLEYMERMGVSDSDAEDIEIYDPHYIFRSTQADSVALSYIVRAMLGETIIGIQLAKEVQLSDVPFFSTVDDFESSIDWDSLDSLHRIGGQTYWLSMSDKDSVYNILRDEILFHCGHMTREWDEYKMMFMYRFRNIGPPSISSARELGITMNADKNRPGSPAETHGMAIPYNAVNVNIGNYQISVLNRNASIVGDDERRTLTIKPVISMFEISGDSGGGGFTFSGIADVFEDAFKVGGFLGEAQRKMGRLLAAVSSFYVEQQKGTTTMQWLYPVGREIFVTDETAHRPNTHELGLDLEPALITEMSFDIGKQKGEINYRIGSSTDALVYGIAPACLLTSGSFTKTVGQWGGQPEDHEYTLDTSPKDVYYFDCWDFPSGPNSPVERDCSCGNYAVWVHEVGTYNWTPLEYTCAVSAGGLITLYGDTTNINLAKNYIVTFREYDDLEDCQKEWTTMADDNNTIGAANNIAHRWV